MHPLSDEPATSAVACLGCGKPVDRLRAGHVAILDGKFVYFCNVACKLAYHEGRRAQLPDDVETIAPPSVAVSMPRAPKLAREERASTQASSTFAWVGIAAAALTPASVFFGASAGHVRVGLTLLAGLCVSGRTFVAGSNAARSLLYVAPPLVALGASMSAEIRGIGGELQASTLTLFAAALQGVWLVFAVVEQRVHEEIDAASTTVASHLGEEDLLFVRRLLQFTAAWAPALSLLVGGIVRINSGSWELGFAVLAAVLMILQCQAFLLAARQLIFAASCRAEDLGIRFRDIDSYECLGRVDACAFSARGVVYAGLPEVTEIHSFGGATEDRVIQLATAVAGFADETIHQGLERALKARGLTRETVRGVRSSATGAVSALDESAQCIVFGTRSQIVEEKFSVAIADEMATAHEEQARAVFLVALGERVVGSIVLQSVLRPEVRSAVRMLINLGVEPILMSEDSADATAALALGLGVTHVRADLPMKARANAIRDLATAGRTVAVVGLSKRDAEPMLAAHAAIALDATSTAPWAAAVATTDMRVAAQAISLPRALRKRLPRALLISLIPSLVAIGLTTLNLVHLALVPVATLAGLGVAIFYARVEPHPHAS